jgi:hypothetical protein
MTALLLVRMDVTWSSSYTYMANMISLSNTFRGYGSILTHMDPQQRGHHSS